MKKILFILSLLLNTSIALSQWIQQNTGVNNPLRDIEFINRYTGWTCGDNIILKTTNGGKNWLQQISNTNNLIQQIHPVDSNIVYAVGWFNTILKTTNGGTNWLIIRNGQFGNGNSYEGLYFINKDTGWICGGNYILRTTDGGQTFDSTFVPGDHQDIYFKDFTDGVVCGPAAAFYRTSNAGLSWQYIQVQKGFTQFNFYRLSFLKNDFGWLAGASGPVFRTTDFGVTWDSISKVSNGFDDIYCIEFIDTLIGWVGGQNGFIFKTIDGGLNWIPQQVAQFGIGFIRNIFAFNDSVVWASGGAGKILFTQSGGQVNITSISNEVPNEIQLFQNYPNPFNSKTKFKFSVSKTSNIILLLNDSLGRLIKQFGDKTFNPGVYEVSLDLNDQSSGLFLYTLIIDNETKQTRKMLLIK